MAAVHEAYFTPKDGFMFKIEKYILFCLRGGCNKQHLFFCQTLISTHEGQPGKMTYMMQKNNVQKTNKKKYVILDYTKCFCVS